MKKTACIIFATIIILTQNTLEAQTLKRKGLLGISMQTLTDSSATAKNLDIKKGVFLNNVFPNSTFSDLGAKAGDVLLKINKTSVGTIQDVLSITSEIYEGDAIEIEVYSNGKIIKSSAKLHGRPLESFKNGDVKYSEIVYPGNVLRTILVTPKNKVKPPVVFFIQGYICQTVEVRPNNPIKKLISDWVDAGFAVYRVEKPGMGDSKSVKKCRDINYNEEQIAFEEAYKDLIKNPSINKDNIFIFGHSMGGVIAPLLAKEKIPKGIMAYGTTGKKWYDYMVDLYTIQPKLMGVSDAQIKEDNKVSLPFIKDLLVNKFSSEQILNIPSYKSFLNNEINSFANGQYLGRDISFWQTLSDIDLPKLWSQTNTNVLILYGEYDIQSINDAGSKIIVDTVNEKFKGKATFKLIEKTEHGFLKFNSMSNHLNALQNGSYFEYQRTNYNTIISKETINWMLSKI